MSLDDQIKINMVCTNLKPVRDPDAAEFMSDFRIRQSLNPAAYETFLPERI